DAPVCLTLAATPDRLTLAVSDRGPGIPAEEREQVFERYYRGTTARGVRGSGLGLCIARWIATAHGGTLTVESGPGQGSTFTLSSRSGSRPTPSLFPWVEIRLS
ncbi:MAG TPA: sensor histidine kinase, partial [Chloroflexota bacterium]|nr:sensor histidine kinase [Chloroflexota bacterium]